MCTTCHGDEVAIWPELQELIAESHPDDEATGFEVADLRGLDVGKCLASNNLSPLGPFGPLGPLWEDSWERLRT